MGEFARERLREIDRTYAAAAGRMRATFDRTPPKRRGPRAPYHSIAAVLQRGRDAQRANVDEWLADFQRRHPQSNPNLMGR